MFFAHHILLIPIVAWIIAVICKGLYHYFLGTFTISRVLGSGGMPSVHSSLVTSLTAAIGVKYGIDSELFAICVVFALIIIYDAMNVRFEAGLHAKALNTLMKNEKGFNEMIGHLPEEAFAGSCLGALVGYLLMYI